MTNEEKKAIERIEDFLTTNIIISISSDKIGNSEELKAFISKNEYLAIEFIATMFLKQSKELEELKETLKCTQNSWYEDTKIIEELKKDNKRLLESATRNEGYKIC